MPAPTKPLPPPTRSERLRSRAKTLVLIAAILAFRSSIASAYSVPTGSMIPTILPGDRIFATKYSYGLRLPFTDVWLTAPEAPARGDIVVFQSPADPDGTPLVKRVAALAGDVVAGPGGGRLRVPDGHFWALGDNRGNSADSRVFGPVPYASLRGRARRILWSLDTAKGVRLRVGRTGAALE